MAGFTDCNGTFWTLRLDIAAQRRVRDALNVNLLRIGDGELFTRLGEDAVFLIDVLWCLCEPQARLCRINEAAFARIFDGGGDVIEQAGTALQETIIDFFPRRRKAALRQLAAQASQLAEQSMQQLEQRLSNSSAKPQPSQASATSSDGPGGSLPGQHEPEDANPGTTPAL